MMLTKTEVTLKKTIYFLGSVQGLTYAILAVICIIIYNQPARRFYGDSYMEVIDEVIYNIFLSPQDNLPFHRSFRPRVFAGFVWIHFILHLIWCGLSLEAMRRNSRTYTKCSSFWSLCTLLVCLWDFITFVIVAADYRKCLDWADKFSKNEKLSQQALCANGMLPVLVIAAKGFTLWLMNIIFAIVVYSLTSYLKKPNQTSHLAPIQRPVSVQPYESPVQRGYQTSDSEHPIPYGFLPPNSAVAQQPGFRGQYPLPQKSMTYMRQPSSPSTYPNTSAGSSVINRNQFQYPVQIPEVDYYPSGSSSLYKY